MVFLMKSLESTSHTTIPTERGDRVTLQLRKFLRLSSHTRIGESLYKGTENLAVDLLRAGRTSVRRACQNHFNIKTDII